MGSAVSWLRSYSSQAPTHAVMIGLDGAGKTTILHSLNLGRCDTMTSTLGFYVEYIAYKNLGLLVWNLDSSRRDLPLYRNLYKDAAGVIFVVDSSDAESVIDANDVLQRTLWQLDEMGLGTIPLLVYANKQDLASAMLVVEVRDALGLTTVTGREWHIQGTAASKGEGLKEGLDWFVTQMDMAGQPPVSP